MREGTYGGLNVRIVGGSDGNGGGDGPTVVLMHGFGAPGNDLVGLAGPIAAPQGTRWIFPEAPLPLPPEFGGGPGRAWWMIDMVKIQMAMMTGVTRDMTKEEPEGLAPANAKINAMLDELTDELTIDRAKMVLGGFSQGAMLACDVALRGDFPLAGLMLMSGTYLAEEVWAPRMSTRKGLPVLQSHGRQDPLLPFAVAELLRDALGDAGLGVTWVPFDGGHGIAPSVIDAATGFLADALG